jgi:hypothetical protein
MVLISSLIGLTKLRLSTVTQPICVIAFGSEEMSKRHLQNTTLPSPTSLLLLLLLMPVCHLLLCVT